MTRKKWEIALREARELKKRGAEILYERVVLLSQCFDDEGFRQWCDDQGTNAAEYLDGELSDTAAEFLTLRAVLDAYPDREQWLQHNIRELIAITVESSRSKSDGSERMSWKARCAELERECEQLRAEVNALKKTLDFVVSAKEHSATA